MEELELEVGNVQLTPEGHKRLKEELESLTGAKRQEIAQRIRDSKDHGEFAEDNNELDEVKNEQAIVESRIAELKTILSSATVLELSDIPTDHVGLGSYVTVEDTERGFDFQVRIVASIEANAEEDLISEESPMGEALYGLKIGEVAEFTAPIGQLKYTVKKISAKP